MLPGHESPVGVAAGKLALDLSGETARLLGESLKVEPTLDGSSSKIRSLTQAIRRGNAAAFSEFYDLYSLRLYKYVLVLAGGNDEIAREVCQIAFIKVAKRIGEFESEPRLWAWLSTLARNTFLDLWRSTQRELERGRQSAENASPPGEPALELTEWLSETLAELSSADRELLQSAYVDERPLQEIADARGDTYKAIESRLARLRKKVRERLMTRLRSK